MSDFRALLVETLAAGPKSSVEEAWCTLRESLISVRSLLPTIPEVVEEDWVTDAVCEASRKKRDMWTRCQKSPGDEGLRHQYMLFKAESLSDVWTRLERSGGRPRLLKLNSWMSQQ